MLLQLIKFLITDVGNLLTILKKKLLSINYLFRKILISSVYDKN